ncbi:hypothetical protein EJ08DRAFT_664971 [Tothia fuscella]|uniref:Uncharacterized protein n=1 Tax=Tothia fuscella TaxID=1048955 RepID=A0A9P4NHM7_9PEZI|nr:hypothetical protein EJ08DRAFT_664971 [Tothia fuscella]
MEETDLSNGPPENKENKRPLSPIKKIGSYVKSKFGTSKSPIKSSLKKKDETTIAASTPLPPSPLAKSTSGINQALKTQTKRVILENRPTIILAPPQDRIDAEQDPVKARTELDVHSSHTARPFGRQPPTNPFIRMGTPAPTNFFGKTPFRINPVKDRLDAVERFLYSSGPRPPISEWPEQAEEASKRTATTPPAEARPSPSSDGTVIYTPRTRGDEASSSPESASSPSDGDDTMIYSPIPPVRGVGSAVFDREWPDDIFPTENGKDRSYADVVKSMKRVELEDGNEEGREEEKK